MCVILNITFIHPNHSAPAGAEPAIPEILVVLHERLHDVTVELHSGSNFNISWITIRVIDYQSRITIDFKDRCDKIAPLF